MWQKSAEVCLGLLCCAGGALAQHKSCSSKMLIWDAGLPVISSVDNRALDSEIYSRNTSASAAQPRFKGEPTDERKQRKTAVKEAKVWLQLIA